MSRRRREKRICTDGMFDETRSLCEDYASAMKRLEENSVRLKSQISRLESATSDFEKVIYDSDISKLRAQIREDDENTSYFRWALSHLSEREQRVMTQLYVEGYTWDSVVSESGEKMTSGAINSARKKAIRKMAILITDKKKMMAESPD